MCRSFNPPQRYQRCDWWKFRCQFLDYCACSSKRCHPVVFLTSPLVIRTETSRRKVNSKPCSLNDLKHGVLLSCWRRPSTWIDAIWIELVNILIQKEEKRYSERILRHKSKLCELLRISVLKYSIADVCGCSQRKQTDFPSVALLRSAISAFQNFCVSPEFLNQWSLFLKQCCGTQQALVTFGLP